MTIVIDCSAIVSIMDSTLSTADCTYIMDRISILLKIIKFITSLQSMENVAKILETLFSYDL